MGRHQQFPGEPALDGPLHRVEHVIQGAVFDAEHEVRVIEPKVEIAHDDAVALPRKLDGKVAADRRLADAPLARCDHDLSRHTALPRAHFPVLYHEARQHIAQECVAFYHILANGKDPALAGSSSVTCQRCKRRLMYCSYSSSVSFLIFFFAIVSLAPCSTDSMDKGRPFYSERSAMTGSFLAADCAGMRPEMSVRTTLTQTMMNAVSAGSEATPPIPVSDSSTRLMTMQNT